MVLLQGMDIMIKFIIADDHQILRQGIISMLTSEEDLQCIGEASNGSELLNLLSSDHADVVLMDINMPFVDGMDATKIIVEKYPLVRILALTMLEQGSFVKQMLRNGASGYLLKTAAKEEVIHAMRTVHGGKRYLSQRATELLMDTVSKQSSSVPPDADLTRREKEVLRLIADGYPDSEIAEKLHLQMSTVESHRKNVRHKLLARNSAEMVKIAMERGLI